MPAPPLDENGPSPIFIGGHHRSGTTLLRVMLHRHPRIACGPEAQLLDRTDFRKFHAYLEDTWLPQLRRCGLEARDLDRAVGEFMNSFFTRYQLQRGKARWAEKTPKNILHIDYLFRLFPNARFIHVIRDPRDIHCSVRAKALGDTPRWASITAEQTALSWSKRINKGLAWRSDPGRYVEVRYEDLVREPAETMKAVLHFLQEPWDDRVLEFRDEADMPRVNRSIFTTSVGRWRQDLAESDLTCIESIAGALMARLGYVPLAHAETWRTSEARTRQPGE